MAGHLTVCICVCIDAVTTPYSVYLGLEPVAVHAPTNPAYVCWLCPISSPCPPYPIAPTQYHIDNVVEPPQWEVCVKLTRKGIAWYMIMLHMTYEWEAPTYIKDKGTWRIYVTVVGLVLMLPHARNMEGIPHVDLCRHNSQRQFVVMKSIL